MKFPYDKLASACAMFLAKASIEFTEGLNLDREKVEEARNPIARYMYAFSLPESLAPKNLENKRLKDAIETLKTPEGQAAFSDIFYEAMYDDHHLQGEEVVAWFQSQVVFRAKALSSYLNSDNLASVLQLNSPLVDTDTSPVMNRFLTDEEQIVLDQEEDAKNTEQLAKEFGVEDKLEHGLKN